VNIFFIAANFYLSGKREKSGLMPDPKMANLEYFKTGHHPKWMEI